MWLGDHVSGVLFLFNVHILPHLLRGFSKIYQETLGCQDIPKIVGLLETTVRAEEE